MKILSCMVCGNIVIITVFLINLEYCPTVWDPSFKQLSDQIERVQNRAMCTILGKPSGTCSHTLRSELNWRTLYYDRRRLRRGIATYKIVNKLSPPYLHDIFTSNANSIGRNRDNLFVMRPNTNWLRNSFTYRSTILWNSLNNNTRTATSVSSFIHNFCT